jgi:nucleoside-diphosphate-sugar epimerase
MTTSCLSGMGGFLGKHLADTLLREGHRVAGIPRDLFLDTEALTHYLIEARPDYIFHLGAYGGQRGQTDVDQCLATNIFNTYILLKFSAQLPLKKFIYVGTSSEYGKKNKTMSETDLLEPITPYAITKACGSLLTRLFNNTVVVRPFSMFGEGEAPWKLIPTVTKALKSGEKITISSLPKHDWIYVGDAASAIVKVAKSNLTGIVNIGSGKQYTNLEIIRFLEKIAHKKLDYIDLMTGRHYDSPYWVANINKLKSIGFTQTYGLRCGLKRTYDYY